MSKQADIIRELQDRLNAAEAICQDLLSHLYNSDALSSMTTALNTHKKLLNVEKLKPRRNNFETT